MARNYGKKRVGLSQDLNTLCIIRVFHQPIRLQCQIRDVFEA